MPREPRATVSRADWRAAGFPGVRRRVERDAAESRDLLREGPMIAAHTRSAALRLATVLATLALVLALPALAAAQSSGSQGGSTSQSGTSQTSGSETTSTTSQSTTTS